MRGPDREQALHLDRAEARVEHVRQAGRARLGRARRHREEAAHGRKPATTRGVSVGARACGSGCARARSSCRAARTHACGGGSAAVAGPCGACGGGRAARCAASPGGCAGRGRGSRRGRAVRAHGSPPGAGRARRERRAAGPCARPRRAGGRCALRCAARSSAGATTAACCRPARAAVERPALVVEREQRGEAREVDPPTVADDRVEPAARGLPHGRPGVRPERPRRVQLQVRDEDEVADDRRRPGDLLAQRAHPARLAGARVERVEVAVVGTDVDGRRPAADLRRPPVTRRRSPPSACATRACRWTRRTRRRCRSCCRCRRARTRRPPTSRSCPRRCRASCPWRRRSSTPSRPFERRIAWTLPP